MTATEADDAPFLLHGVAAIAAYLNTTPHRIYRLLDRPAKKAVRLPLWKFGGMWSADKRELDNWIDLQNAKAGAAMPD